jgi:hypothetical protein
MVAEAREIGLVNDSGVFVYDSLKVGLNWSDGQGQIRSSTLRGRSGFAEGSKRPIEEETEGHDFEPSHQPFLVK